MPQKKQTRISDHLVMSVDEWYGRGKQSDIHGLNIFNIREGSGEVLICIHGFPTSSWDFAPIWSTLTSKFDTLAYDLIGLGRSSKPEQKLSVSIQADIVEELVLKNEIGEAHILAHDLGNTIAQELLARQAEDKSPINWLSCVFLNGGIFPEMHRPRFIQRLLLSPFGSLVAKLSTENTFSRNMRNIFSKEHPPADEFLEGSWKLLTENNGIQMMPRLIRYIRERQMYRARWVSPLENSPIPLRLINGIQDPISGLHMASYYQEIIPEADVILIEDAGHYPHVEAPDQVLKALFDFHGRLPNHRVYN